MFLKKGRSVVTALFAAAVALVFSAAPAQAQCQGGPWRSSMNTMLAGYPSQGLVQSALRQQQYAMLAALQEQQRNALLAAAYDSQQRQYAVLLAAQQQQRNAALVAAAQQLQQQNAQLAAAVQQRDAMMRAGQMQGRR